MTASEIIKFILFLALAFVIPYAYIIYSLVSIVYEATEKRKTKDK